MNNEKELLVLKKIERICRNWYKNFRIEYKERDIIFTMEAISSKYDNAKTIFYFTSIQGTEFCYREDLTENYIENKKVKEKLYYKLSGIILHIFAQICDTLDGLLNSYHLY